MGEFRYSSLSKSAAIAFLRRVNKLHLSNLADNDAVRFRNDIALVILKDKFFDHGSYENSGSRITFEQC